MRSRQFARRLATVLACLVSTAASGGHFPMYASWPQAGGAGSPLTLTYSYGNVLDGSIATAAGVPLGVEVIKGAFEQAFRDYAEILPIDFVEVPDAGPPPQTGPYDPTGLPQIRIGQVPHVDGANAYAYFPIEVDTNGLAGDVVFNAERFGFGWTPTLFYSVAQHELGHSLGMGHYVDDEPSGEPSLAESAYTGPLFPLDAGMIVALQGAYGAGTGSVTPLTAVPEPHTWVMLLAGLGLLGHRLRRRAA